MVPNKVQDGCYAWVVCGASFLLMVMQGVVLYCTGIFYIILKENLEAEDSQIALVTSLAHGFFTVACKCYGCHEILLPSLLPSLMYWSLCVLRGHTLRRVAKISSDWRWIAR